MYVQSGAGQRALEREPQKKKMMGQCIMEGVRLDSRERKHLRYYGGLVIVIVA